jgi:hypothetical protein
MRNAYTILVWEPEVESLLGKFRLRWEDNIKMDLREVEFGGVDWIHLAQDMDQ